MLTLYSHLSTNLLIPFYSELYGLVLKKFLGQFLFDRERERWKFVEPRSGEYGGRSRTFYSNSWSGALTTCASWSLVLSCSNTHEVQLVNFSSIIPQCTTPFWPYQVQIMVFFGWRSCLFLGGGVSLRATCSSQSVKWGSAVIKICFQKSTIPGFGQRWLAQSHKKKFCQNAKCD